MQIKNAGTYKIWYKVVRANFTTLISSFTITITPKAQTFSVVAPTALDYSGQNHCVTEIDTPDYVSANQYTLTFCDTATGTYTATAPDCVLPGAYTFYVKPVSNNYTFTDESNPTNDYATISFTVTKGDGTSSPLYDLLLPDINAPASEGATYSLDVSLLTDGLASMNLSASDYSISYSTDNEVSYSTTAPVFSTPCTDQIVTIKVATPMYEDTKYFVYVNIAAIPDVTGTVGSAITDLESFEDFIDNAGDERLLPIFQYSFDNKTSWVNSDENNCYTFETACNNTTVYYRILVYKYDETLGYIEDDESWVVIETYVYSFTATVTE